MSEHYLIISTYKKSEIPLIRFHINYLNLIKTERELKFFLLLLILKYLILRALNLIK